MTNEPLAEPENGPPTRQAKDASSPPTSATTSSSSVHRIRPQRQQMPLPPPPPPMTFTTNAAAAGSSGEFHPDFMFCGACTDCNTNDSTTTPPTIASASSSDNDDDLSSSDDDASSELSTELSVTLPSEADASSHHRLLIASLLKPVGGVHRVKVDRHVHNNAATNVRVQHSSACHVDDLIRVLGQGGYPATVVVAVVDGDDNNGNNDNDATHNNGPLLASSSALTANNNNNHHQSAQTHTLPPPPVRTTLTVQGICCASEVPSVRKIVRPLPGVQGLQINITTKRVYVQHHASLISASVLAQTLTQQGFSAQIVRDGGAGAVLDRSGEFVVGNNNNTPTTTTLQQSTVGRTTLHTEKVLHDQDVPVLQQHLDNIPGVVKVRVQVQDCVVSIEHDVAIVSATQLQSSLQQHLPLYQTVLVQDARALLAQTQQTEAILSQPRSQYVESTLSFSSSSSLSAAALTQHVARVVAQHFIRAQVRAVHPHTSSGICKVEHNPRLASISQICQVLEAELVDQYWDNLRIVTDGAQAGLVLPLQMGQDEDDEDADLEEGQQRARNNKTQPNASNDTLLEWQTRRLSLHVWLSGVFWVVALVAAIHPRWPRVVELVAGLLSVLLGLPPVAQKAVRTLRRCEFDANCMMVTAALGALALQEWDEAASVAFLFAVSEYLEARATDKARTALAALVQLRPEHAHVIHPETKQIVVIPAERVPVGSLISVRTGDKVAADGVVVEGTSLVDESSLTGESVPIPKQRHDTVSGGGVNVGDTQLVIRTTTSVQDSAVSRLIRLVEEAQAHRSPTEKMIDSFSRAYTPAVLLVAVVLCTVPWLWGTDVGRQWMLNGLIIVVIACPCALTISTPVTYAAGLAATAQRGIIVKGGASLESLGSVKTVLFDKTGTLTEGKFKIMHLEEIGDTRTRKEMLELLALMEAPSSHPVSATLVQAARHEGVHVPQDKEIREHSILKGEGVTALVEGKRVFVGNVRLFDRVGMYKDLSPKYQTLAKEWNKSGASVGFIGVEGEGMIGIFCVTDVVRPESKDVVGMLMADGINVQMLTGDGEGAAQSIANQVGLAGDRVHSKLLPEDKLHYVGSAKAPSPKHSFKLFRRTPRVLFIGDGVNDAPALAVADVGVSMGEGASLAMEMSDVTLMDSNLHKLWYVIKMGQRVVHTIQENIILSLACKLLVVVLTFLGHMTLLFAIASDVGVMLVVTLNGMKLLPGDTEGGMLSRIRLPNRRVYREVPVRSTDSGSELELGGDELV